MVKLLRILLILAAILAAARSAADEAVDALGNRHSGKLVQKGAAWNFQGDAGKEHAISGIAYIRFSPGKGTPLAKMPLTHRLLLQDGSSVSGRLLRVEGVKVHFAASWGANLAVERDELAGIAQVENQRLVLHDGMESLKEWNGAGESVRQPIFFGTSAIQLRESGKLVERSWKPPVRAGAVRLHFNVEANAKSRWQVAVGGPEARTPVLSITAESIECPGQPGSFGVLRTTPGWRLLCVELRPGRLRVYVDDACLGEVKCDAKFTLSAIRIAAEGDGKLTLDELKVSQTLAPSAWPTSAKDQDAVCLLEGEQLFGKLQAIDPSAIVLDAKFGKLSLPWTDVRGILFAQPKRLDASTEPEIVFRPGPGFALDRIHAKLVSWDAANLVIRHAVLGEVALERGRLERLRFKMK